MDIVLVLGVVLILAFGAVMLVGAPYLPTLGKQVNSALDLLDLKKGQRLLELGAGDGTVALVGIKELYRKTKLLDSQALLSRSLVSLLCMSITTSTYMNIGKRTADDCSGL